MVGGLIRPSRELSSHSAEQQRTSLDVTQAVADSYQSSDSEDGVGFSAESCTLSVSALPPPSTRRLRQGGDCYTAREGAKRG